MLLVKIKLYVLNRVRFIFYLNQPMKFNSKTSKQKHFSGIKDIYIRILNPIQRLPSPYIQRLLQAEITYKNLCTTNRKISNYCLQSQSKFLLVVHKFRYVMSACNSL